MTPKINNKQIRALNAILTKRDMQDEKKSLVQSYSSIGATSSKDLTQEEARHLISDLNKIGTPNADEEQAQKMKKKIIAMAMEMGWTVGGKFDRQRMNNWCNSKSKLHKIMDKHTLSELPELVTQFEIVHTDWSVKNR